LDPKLDPDPVPYTSVADPRHADAFSDLAFHFGADPDPTFHLRMVPDPIFHFNADPGLASIKVMRIHWLKDFMVPL
jgi:hypothetical protein